MLKISKEWAMPNRNTFSIKPINDLVTRVAKNCNVIVDPYANSSKFGTLTNDLNTEYDTDYHTDALYFLKRVPDRYSDLILYDPPYSPRQIKECYSSVGYKPEGNYTQASFWSKQKDEISRISKINSYVISFGWNSNGIGKSRGFEQIEILLVAHGGSHNDTIVVVERKL